MRIDEHNCPDSERSKVPLLSAAERHLLPGNWNRTDRDYPRDRCIHQLFETQAQRTPQAVAAMCMADAVTYRELNVQSDRFALYLQSLGVGPEVLVGLCVERSLDMLVALLGILKAGGAYVPLAPAYPPARLSVMIDDARPPVLLTQQHLCARIPASGTRVVCVDAGEVRAMVRDEN